jgi:hypothetical protein
MRGAHPKHMLTNDASSSVSCNSILQVFKRLDRSKLLLNGNSLPACQVHDIPWKLHLENPGYGVSFTNNKVNSYKDGSIGFQNIPFMVTIDHYFNIILLSTR